MGDATDMGKKTGIELLRELAESERILNCEILQRASGKLCRDLASCRKCVSYAFTAIADRIEREHEEAMAAIEGRLMPEGAEWPRFEDGEPVEFGDEFAWGGRTMVCGAIKLGRLGFDLLDANGGPSSWYGYSYTDRVKRPKPAVHTPHDTQERIDEEAAMECRDYINACGLTWPDGASLGDIEALKCRDLLRRQREFDKRKMGGVR